LSGPCTTPITAGLQTTADCSDCMAAAKSVGEYAHVRTRCLESGEASSFFFFHRTKRREKSLGCRSSRVSVSPGRSPHFLPSLTGRRRTPRSHLTTQSHYRHGATFPDDGEHTATPRPCPSADPLLHRLGLSHIVSGKRIQGAWELFSVWVKSSSPLPPDRLACMHSCVMWPSTTFRDFHHDFSTLSAWGGAPSAFPLLPASQLWFAYMWFTPPRAWPVARTGLSDLEDRALVGPETRWGRPTGLIPAR